MISKDQIGRKLEFNEIPQRIVSLVPSQTELLVDLGLRERIVGITAFCVHPPDLLDQIMTVGGTKKVNYRKIERLSPEIILCNLEENTKEMVEELEKIAPVHVSDVSDIDAALNLIKTYGEIFQVELAANSLIQQIRTKISNFSPKLPGLKVIYLIWKNPYMVAGSGTFIDCMLQFNGWENLIEIKRYPKITLEEIENLEPDLLLLSTEPYAFSEENLSEFKNISKVRIVDGEAFSWFGSRILKALSYFEDVQDSIS